MAIFRPKMVILLIVILFTGNFAAQAQTDFSVWLAEFQEDAVAEGISRVTLKEHLENLAPIPKVRELDRSQLSRKDGTPVSFGEYLQRVVPDFRVKTAREKYLRNRNLFQAIAARFKVDPAYVVALWAIESDFGRRTGSFPTVAALATLAHEGRRGIFFATN